MSSKMSLPKAKKMSTGVLRKKAKLFLESDEHQHLLYEILAVFDKNEYTNYTPLLLTVEMIFTTLLRRKDMYEIVLPMKPPGMNSYDNLAAEPDGGAGDSGVSDTGSHEGGDEGGDSSRHDDDWTKSPSKESKRKHRSNRIMEKLEKTPEAIHCHWLRDAYEVAMGSTITCFKRGDIDSRVQALVSACRILKEEGLNPMESCQGNLCFPHVRLKNIFAALLDSEVCMTELIDRFQEYAEYRDIQQYGLKMISLLAFCHSTVPTDAEAEEFVSESLLQNYRASCQHNTLDKAPNHIFIQNYLELFDKLMSIGLPTSPRPFKYTRHKEDNYLCEKNGRVAFVFNPEICRRYINRCWGFACKWPLRASDTIHRRALHLLVDRILPHLVRPQLAVDLLADSLDTGTATSTLAMRGLMELVTRHKIDYPEIYDRLYGLFEPEMFESRSKKRLMHLAEIFLSSTHISEALVAAFAKRLARLALLASPEDALDLLQLISILLESHPGLKKMLRNDQPAVLPQDPYVMEESCAIASRAINSSLWEVSALRLHFTPEVCATANRVLAVAEGSLPLAASNVCDNAQFDAEIRKRFKTIEMNFVRISSLANLTAYERFSRLWNMEQNN